MDFCKSILLCIVIFTLLHENVSALSLQCGSRTVSPKDFNVKFFFSTKSALDQYYSLNSNKSLTNIDFSLNLRTIFIVHGFLSSHKVNSIINMRNAFLQWENVNVITVDWNEGGKKIFGYSQAAANTQTVASQIKTFVLQLLNTHKKSTPIDKLGHFHFVGHSLGSHIVGQAAKLLKEDGVIIDRITGLDPARPCFVNVDPALRLSANDARFVDVIHTNGDDGFGIFEPIGDVDFYVNGGRKQPGCLDFDIKKFIFKKPLKYPMSYAFCHHNRAMSLFTQSLIQKTAKQCKFYGRPWKMDTIERYNKKIGVDECNDSKCLEMGISAHDVDTKTKTFYVATTGESPYCNIY